MRRLLPSSLLAIISVLLLAPVALAADAGAFVDGTASAGALGPVREAPAPDGLKGIDVSHWNDRIRWSRVAKDDVVFAIAKATEGARYDDPMYARNHSQARREGIAFTAYEFADPDPRPRDPIKDARHFLDVAELRPTDLVPVLDLEATGGLNDRELLAWTTAWCDEVEKQIGARPMVYTSPSFWHDHVRDSTDLAVAGTRLWIAHWFVDAPTLPADDWNGTGWSIWQWSDRGRVDGIAGRVDMDVLFDTTVDPLVLRNARSV